MNQRVTHEIEGLDWMSGWNIASQLPASANYPYFQPTCWVFVTLGYYMSYAPWVILLFSYSRCVYSHIHITITTTKTDAFSEAINWDCDLCVFHFVSFKNNLDLRICFLYSGLSFVNFNNSYSILYTSDRNLHPIITTNLVEPAILE